MTNSAGRVIFNADDFGLAPQVNEAVDRACREGVVRSASLLATGPAFAEACRLAHALPQLSVGLHVALVHEVPACDPAQIPSLVDPQGRLLPKFGAFLKKRLGGRIRREELALELQAQAQRLLDAGLRPTHLDSHQHLHLLPEVFALCLDLCEELHIPFIRVPGGMSLQTRGSGVSLPRLALFTGLVTLARLDRKRLAQTGIRCCEGVWGLLQAGHHSLDSLCAFLPDLGPGLHEFACHPAAGSAAGYTRYDWGYDWQRELDALTSPVLADRLAELGLTLTDFRTAANA
jgi:chitin disaccharide deacetylase